MRTQAVVGVGVGVGTGSPELRVPEKCKSQIEAARMLVTLGQIWGGSME